ncbi:MAG: GtrA family protein [Pseudomonadota bacterium]
MSGRVRHIGGFVLGGVAALLVDLAVLELLTRGFSLSPFIARLPAIAVAMVASWLINRTITFAVETPPTLAEFAKFAAVSWVAQAVNYSAFALILLAFPSLPPAAAVILGCGPAVAVAYAGFRFGVFRKPTPASTSRS